MSIFSINVPDHIQKEVNACVCNKLSRSKIATEGLKLWLELRFRGISSKTFYTWVKQAKNVA